VAPDTPGVFLAASLRPGRLLNRARPFAPVSASQGTRWNFPGGEIVARGPEWPSDRTALIAPAETRPIPLRHPFAKGTEIVARSTRRTRTRHFHAPR